MPLDLRGMTTLLQVYDMPTSVRFYRDTLGFEVVSTSPPLGGQDRFHWSLLRRGDLELMLNTAYEFDHERPVPPDAARVQGHGDTGLFIGCPDVDAAYRELQGKVADLRPPTTAPYGMRQLSFRDPDGYGICLQWSIA